MKLQPLFRNSKHTHTHASLCVKFHSTSFSSSSKVRLRNKIKAKEITAMRARELAHAIIIWIPAALWKINERLNMFLSLVCAMPIFTATGHLREWRIREFIWRYQSPGVIYWSLVCKSWSLRSERLCANHLQLRSFRWALINFTSAKTSSTTLTVQTAKERELQIGAHLFLHCGSALREKCVAKLSFHPHLISTAAR